MSGPHPSTRVLIGQITKLLADKGTMTFDELYEALGVSKPRLRVALTWALRTIITDDGHRRYRLSSQLSLLESTLVDTQAESARKIIDTRPV